MFQMLIYSTSHHASLCDLKLDPKQSGSASGPSRKTNTTTAGKQQDCTSSIHMLDRKTPFYYKLHKRILSQKKTEP